MNDIIREALESYKSLAEGMHDTVCQSFSDDVDRAIKAIAALDAEPAQAIKVPEGWKVEFPDTGYGEMIVTAPNGMIDIAHKDTEHVTEQLLRAILSGTKVE